MILASSFYVVVVFDIVIVVQGLWRPSPPLSPLVLSGRRKGGRTPLPPTNKDVLHSQ